MNNNHFIMAIDPGVAVGAVYLRVNHLGQAHLVGWHQEKHTFTEAVHWFKNLLITLKPDAVVIEDYRIYASHAGHHIGVRLYTPELIGAFAALCELNGVPLVRLSASKKDRWPFARLKSRFPRYVKISTPHALDALKLGLAYLEDGGVRFPREET